MAEVFIRAKARLHSLCSPIALATAQGKWVLPNSRSNMILKFLLETSRRNDPFAEATAAAARRGRASFPGTEVFTKRPIAEVLWEERTNAGTSPSSHSAAPPPIHLFLAEDQASPRLNLAIPAQDTGRVKTKQTLEDMSDE